MIAERMLISSLLKLTKKGVVECDALSVDARLPSSVTLRLLKTLQKDGLITVNGSSVEVDTTNRLKLAVKSVSSGSDVERVSDFLCWQEFEEIAALALRLNGYVTKKNVRFKHGQKRWEIDVVGCRKPVVICVDCKHYHQILRPSLLKKMVDAQIKRVASFADSLPNISSNIECVKWSKATFVPAILSLIPSSFKFLDDVPVVPVLQVQDFINQLPIQMASLKHFNRVFNHLD